MLHGTPKQNKLSHHQIVHRSQQYIKQTKLNPPHTGLGMGPKKMNWMTFASNQTKCEICFGCQEWYWMAFMIFGKELCPPPPKKKGKYISKSLLCFVPDFRSNFDIFMLFLITNIDDIQPGWNKGLSRLKCPRVPFSLLAWLVNFINSIIKVLSWQLWHFPEGSPFRCGRHCCLSWLLLQIPKEVRRTPSCHC